MMTDNMNYKQFGIMDVEGNQIAAGAGFAYRGWVISMSQIWQNLPDVVVFDNDSASDVVYTAKSVQDAIEWCNEQLTGFKY